MLDFIMIPAIMAIIFSCIYGLFELFARRKERMLLIEKMTDLPVMDTTNLQNYNSLTLNFSALKFGALLVGIGLGLLTGLLIDANIEAIKSLNKYNRLDVIYGATTLLFGGLGLLIAYLIEYKITQKENISKK